METGAGLRLDRKFLVAAAGRFLGHRAMFSIANRPAQAGGTGGDLDRADHHRPGNQDQPHHCLNPQCAEIIQSLVHLPADGVPDPGLRVASRNLPHHRGNSLISSLLSVRNTWQGNCASESVKVMQQGLQRRPTLGELWDSAQKSIFVADHTPEYLKRMILPGTPKATAVKLRMHGEIRLGRWRTFRAEEVIDRDRGFVWKARVGRLISGADALVDGRASARWNVLGIFPVMRTSGPDVTRSAIGRWLLESVWLPTMLRPDDGAAWEGSTVTLSRLGETGRLQLDFKSDGLKGFRMSRWGNPDGSAYGYHPFGGIVEERRRFGGFVLPSRVRVGWHYGTSSWDRGEFFRATIKEAQFR